MSAGSDKTGYRQPPSEYQFKPGRSGNPRGRPRKRQPSPMRLQDSPMRSLRAAEFYRILNLQENGEPIELPAAQALMRAIVNSALKGNRLNQRYLREVIERDEREADERAVKQYEDYRTLKRKGEAAIARAQQEHLPAPVLYPHPADIILDPLRQTVSVIGPMSEEEMPAYRPVMLWRDLFIGCHAGAAVGQVRCDSAKQRDYAGLSLAMAGELNRSLPPSLRRTDASMAGLVHEWSELSGREYAKRWAVLYKEVHSLPPDPKTLVEEHKQHQNAFAASMQAMAKATEKSLKGSVRQKLNTRLKPSSAEATRDDRPGPETS